MIDQLAAERIVRQVVDSWSSTKHEPLTIELVEDWEYGWFFNAVVAETPFPFNVLLGAPVFFVRKSSGEVDEINPRTDLEEFKREFIDRSRESNSTIDRG